MSLTYPGFYLSSQDLSDFISFNRLLGSCFHLISVFTLSIVSIFRCLFGFVLETSEVREGLGSLNCGYGVDFVVLD